MTQRSARDHCRLSRDLQIAMHISMWLLRKRSDSRSRMRQIGRPGRGPQCRPVASVLMRSNPARSRLGRCTRGPERFLVRPSVETSPPGLGNRTCALQSFFSSSFQLVAFCRFRPFASLAPSPHTTPDPDDLQPRGDHSLHLRSCFCSRRPKRSPCQIAASQMKGPALLSL